MKKFRLLLVAGLVLAAGAPRANLVTTINVTTFDDEDGTGAACSLREAVTAASRKAPYGGCPAGNAFTDHLLQLEAGTYSLTRGELYVDEEIIIAGKDSKAEERAEEKDPLTGQAPRRARPDYRDSSGSTGTRLVAAPNSRIAFAVDGLTLRDLVLEGSGSDVQVAATSVAGNGGVIYASAAASLENVIIRGGRATGTGVAAGNGGAIYLAGNNSSIALTDVSVEDSFADNSGGAIAMLCKLGTAPRAAHSLTLTRVLLRGNEATLGAGAIDACGDTALSMTSSTLSANRSAAGSGAVEFLQSGADVGKGKLSLRYVTAAEQVGHVLTLSGLAEIQLTGSLLSGFTTPGSLSVCHNPNAGDGIPFTVMAAAAGSYNAIDSDGGCDSLLRADGTNVVVGAATPLSDVLVAIPAYGSAYPASAGGAPYGLSDYYLPRQGTAESILDKGEPFEACLSTDQRNLERRSGARCDIGAVERLVLTARDDNDSSVAGTDRLAIVDILANDSFGESESGVPYQFAANDDPSRSVVLVDDAGGRCKWMPDSDELYPGKLVVDNGGVLTTDGAPVVCTYRARNTEPADSAVATVRVQVRNIAPRAVDDSFLRPVGESTVYFNPLENDTDGGDGKYGLVQRLVPDPLNPSNPPTIEYGPEAAWAAFYPIEIEQQPQLGTIIGASSGICPGSSTLPRTCLTPPLRYVANNSSSPFSDTFTYRVFDANGVTSSAAAVTVFTDAPDPDKGGGAGSLDFLGALALVLLGLRRFLRL